MLYRPLPILLSVMLSGCVRDEGAGPALGACAELPTDGSNYTFGEIGIGTCLAGPADMAFRNVRGEEWLVVSNADPFRTFIGGSLLHIDETALITLSGTETMDEQRAFSLQAEAFVGGFAFQGDIGILASRNSPGEVFRDVDDRIWLLDGTDADAVRYQPERFLPVGADPFAVEQGPPGRFFVVNSVSPSVSVIDASRLPLALLDASPIARVTTPVFQPQPTSTGIAEVRAARVEATDLSQTDAWSLTRVSGTTRLFAPEGNGLQRYSSGNELDFRRGAVSIEVLPPSGADAPGEAEFDEPCPSRGRIEDPWLGTFDGALVSWFREIRCGSDGAAVSSIRTAATEGPPVDWVTSTQEGLLPDAGWTDISAPSVAPIDGRSVMWFDGVYVAPDGVDSNCPDGPAIGRATSNDGLTFSGGPAVLCLPDGYTDLAQPSVLPDPITGRLRMWLSLFDGTDWVVGLTQSPDDGRTWGELELVLGTPGTSVGAPVVTWFGGQYRMWLTVETTTGWAHANATSFDGHTWSDPVVVVDSDRPADRPRPPRAAIQPSPTEAWRLSGEDAGVLTDLLAEGTTFLSTARGLQVQVASGHVAGRTAGADLDGGLIPGAVLRRSGLDTLYATGRNADGVRRLLALRELPDGRWVVTSNDLIPEGTGGNVDGARSPVVWEQDGVVQMIYAAAQGDVWRLRRATSTDGLTFTDASLSVEGERASWEALERLPHSVTVAADGITLWYAGTDGRRYRIGALQGTSPDAWSVVRGRRDPWVFGVGDPGTFDDSGVRDPLVVVRDGVEWMLYAADDGTALTLGIAWRPVGEAAWTRMNGPRGRAPAPVLPGVPDTYSDRGVGSPVLLPDGDGLLVSGIDGFTWRTGRAVLAADGEVVEGANGPVALPVPYPAHRVTTAGDRFTFDTVSGTPGRSAIRLDQVVDNTRLPGVPGTRLSSGYTSAAYDAARGFLYVGSKDFPGLVVIDVRDDASSSRTDRNYLDIEAVLRFDTTTDTMALHDMRLGPNGHLYISVRNPDGVLVVDPGVVVDDDTKDVVRGAALGLLPVHDAADDDGSQTFAAVGAAGLDLSLDGRTLVVPHMSDNSVSVYDLTLGEFGLEIAHIEDVGEQPSLARIAPSGDYAVVSTYLGDGPGEADGSTLLVIDLDPSSPDYLQVRGRLVNR